MKAPNTKQMVMACAACLLTLGLALPSGATAEEYIPFNNTGITVEKMPRVFFTHDKHVGYVGEDGNGGRGRRNLRPGRRNVAVIGRCGRGCRACPSSPRRACRDKGAESRCRG